MRGKTELARYEIGIKATEVGAVVFGSIFLALLSQVAVPLPFTPIPMTLQTLGVCILGGTLGGRVAAWSVLAYLVQGTCGLPVFAGGLSNPLWWISGRAGFLFSFVVAAYIIGKMVERRPQASVLYLLSSVMLGEVAIFTMGALWLSLYVGFPQAIVFGVVPFLSGEAIKVGLGTLALKGWHFLKAR